MDKVIRTIGNRVSRPDIISYAFFCPGCKHGHPFNSTWKFNGDFDKPTITPSILAYGDEDQIKETNGKYGHRCHSFITNGMIKFLSDCTHDLKNQTVPLKPF